MVTTHTDWITIVALITSPILAVQAESFIKKITGQHKNKSAIFSTLMKTRAERLSIEHVSALNMIDIVFYGRKALGLRIQSKKDRKVISCWKTYLNHLGKRYDGREENAWTREANTLFIALLGIMAEAIGYHFDSVDLENNIYKPNAHEQAEKVYQSRQDVLDEILNGQRPIPVKLDCPPLSENQQIIQQSILDHLQGKTLLRVELANTSTQKKQSVEEAIET